MNVNSTFLRFNKFDRNIRNLSFLMDNRIFIQIFQNQVQLQPKLKGISLNPYNGKESANTVTQNRYINFVPFRKHEL
jgi:hypothetical protein